MKKNKIFWWFFKRLTSYIFIILTSVFLITLFSTDANFGINKTVGWAWDFSNINFWFGIFQVIVFLLVILLSLTFIIMKISNYIKR
ncbi:hypothetical protein GCM10011531_07590 [Aquaticitalea lipolytica]|uniref:Uncharacterized protein n=1 Tax=Aquaticitalea lipolytica TaxID=1247562 RepID=A0A8J2XFQ6_9FLAO|nr:hypothetical protein [Aquaticitalea lipolytica]GFZ80072.1 hypothetical protein GCM10011531_07590 [Aquaticitalea lipolytica]